MIKIFIFNDTATTEIYTLSLHDALPISLVRGAFEFQGQKCSAASRAYIPRSIWHRLRDPFLEEVDGMSMGDITDFSDRKSTRLNSSHANISYAVFCLKKNIIFLILIRVR